MKKFAWCSLLMVSSQLLWSQKIDFNIAEIFPVESEHSYVGFSIRYMGYAMVRGRFTNFQGSLRYREGDPAMTSITLSIDVASIDTGNAGRDKDLRSENWFDAGAYPRISFVSTNAEVTTEGLRITGDLTMRGITKAIVVPLEKPSGVVLDVRGDSQVIFTGALTINRRDFGVEGKRWDGIKEGITAVSDRVEIEITVLGKRINEKNFRNWVNNIDSPEGKIYATAKSSGIEKALKEFDLMRKESGGVIDEWALNNTGMMLLKEKKVTDALQVFKKNMDTFPERSLVYASYAEALATVGRWSEASTYFGHALQKDSGNMNAREIMRHIRPAK